jgi:hypothetical protein
VAERADEAACLTGHGLRDREPEAGAATVGLGGEKRIEDMPQGSRVHAAAVVRDGEHHVLAAADRAASARRRVLDQLDVGRDADALAVAERGVGRIAHQVHQHLAHARTVEREARVLGVQ